MTRIVQGDRIARQARIRLGCSAVLFNQDRSRILLTRRKDNGQWCLPGGMIEPGETVTEACIREVLEETGLHVSVLRLTGVYSDPDQVIIYPDGVMNHVIVLNFEVKLTSGDLSLSEETDEIRYFPGKKAVTMELFHGHAQHIRDALQNRPETFLR